MVPSCQHLIEYIFISIFTTFFSGKRTNEEAQKTADTPWNDSAGIRASAASKSENQTKSPGKG